MLSSPLNLTVISYRISQAVSLNVKRLTDVHHICFFLELIVMMTNDAVVKFKMGLNDYSRQRYSPFRPFLGVRINHIVLNSNDMVGMKMPTDMRQQQLLKALTSQRLSCSHLVSILLLVVQRHDDISISSITIYHHTIGKINNATNNWKKRKKEED